MRIICPTKVASIRLLPLVPLASARRDQSSLYTDIYIRGRFGGRCRITRLPFLLATLVPQGDLRGSLQQTAADGGARDGGGSAVEEGSDGRREALKFASARKVKARGGRKTNDGGRRVTFADH